MRGFFFILCLLVNVSVVLMPFSTVHAHIDSAAAESAEIHGGHRHDFGHGHGSEHSQDHDHSEDFDDLAVTEPADGGTQVVDLDSALAYQSNLLSIAGDVWLPLACVVAVLAIGLQFCLAILRPPQSDADSSTQRGYWRPPLRGPPLSIPTV